MPRQKKELSKADQLLDELLQDYSTPDEILGSGGLLKQLTARLVERALQGELTHYLDQSAADPDAAHNSRNGFSSKTVQTDQGSLELQIPRDRRSQFQPVLVPKGQRHLAGLDEKILALYARGASTRDIQAQLRDLYGVDISHELVSQVTDAVLPELKQWQHRPLEAVYPIVWLDALQVKVRRDGRVQQTAIYLVLGVNRDGYKELLGMWSSPTEGAKFWMSVLTDLKNRGVQHICIACVDGLTGFPEAIAATFPETRVQLCIVHLVRNSLKYASWKHRKEVAADLKTIYRAPTVAAAEDALTEFAQKWDETYPTISGQWLRQWEHIIPLFDYPPDIQRVMYTTNAIESLNRSMRKVLKTKGSFPSEEAVMKQMYLALGHISEKWTRPIGNWKAALARFAIEYPDCFTD